jgi:predicted nucleic acid-binding Zn ribbon protein
MSFDKLVDILKKLQAQNPALSKRVEEASALSRWETAVGPQIAKHTRAIRIQDSVLWIEVDHPIWKTELHYRKRQILTALNSPGQATLKDLLLLDGRPRKE